MTSNKEPLRYKSDFGDARLDNRLNRIVNTLVDHGTAGIRSSFGDEHQIKSVYRFMSHEKVTFSGIESSEQSRLYEVLNAQKPPLLIHLQDTTTLKYSQKQSRSELPCLNYIDHRGYFLHNSILLDEKGNVLGLSQQELWGRSEKDLGRSRSPGTPRNLPVECQESERFVRHFQDFECLMQSFPESQGISVCDREGDFYELLSAKSVSNVDLLVRVHHDRLIQTLEGTAQKLLAAVGQSPSLGEYWTEILVKGSTHQTRPVCLTVRICPIGVLLPETLKWSKTTSKSAKKRTAESQELPFWVVQVTEKNPPAGVEPIEWTLLTTRPLRDYWDALQIVQIYKLRWIIEIFHMVLKEGYALEELQLHTAHRIQNAIALFSLAAIQITRLRYASLFSPDTPLTQWGFKTWNYNLLALYLNQQYADKIPLADEQHPPSMQEFCKLIHRMGGGKRNQPVGIRSLWTGWHEAQIVWNTALLFYTG
jgi:hypothetical protein